MRILVNRDGQQLGPYTQEEAQAAVQSGTLSPTDLAWVEGTPAWVPLSTLLPGAAPSLRVPVAGQNLFVGGQTTSGNAVTSLVLGIVSFVCCLSWIASVPAIICGHIARSQIRSEPQRLKGEGMAFAGLLLGYFNLLLVVAAIALYIPYGEPLIEKLQETALLTSEPAIALSCQSFARAHDGKYPETLEELVPDYVTDRKILRGQAIKPGEAEGYQYLQAGKSSPKADEVLIISNWKNAKGEQAVARVDGTAHMEKYEAP